MPKLLKWEVASDEPSHFGARAWPMAWFRENHTSIAARIECSDSYNHKRAKSGEHAPLALFVARWYEQEGATYERNGRRVKVPRTFEWRRVANTFSTLAEAKQAAETVLRHRIDLDGWLLGDRPRKTQAEKDEIRKRAIVLALLTDANIRADKQRPAWSLLSVDELMDFVETVLHLDARYEEED